MGFRQYLITRAITMFGVLIATVLLTIALVGDSMDTIQKTNVEIETRDEIGKNPHICQDINQLEECIQKRIDDKLASLGLDKPWYSPNRLVNSVWQIMALDFGHAKFLTSDSGSSDVKDIILEKIPKTILLFTTSTIIISIIGIFVGILAGSKINSKLDRLISSFSVISSSFPVWWVGVLMIFVFVFVYPIFPETAAPSISTTDPSYFAALLYHMILPLVTIVLIGFGSWAYLVRNFVIGILQEEFIAAKRTAGISEKNILFRHVLKNAAPPIVTVLALSLSSSLGGAIITEAVFDWPGMGRLYYDAIAQFDLPVIIGETYVLTAFFLASVFLSDILYGYFDPRVRVK